MPKCSEPRWLYVIGWNVSGLSSKCKITCGLIHLARTCAVGRSSIAGTVLRCEDAVGLNYLECENATWLQQPGNLKHEVNLRSSSLSLFVDSNSKLKDWRCFLVEGGRLGVWDWRVETGVVCLPGGAAFLLLCVSFMPYIRMWCVWDSVLKCIRSGTVCLCVSHFMSDVSHSYDISVCYCHPHYKATISSSQQIFSLVSQHKTVVLRFKFNFWSFSDIQLYLSRDICFYIYTCIQCYKVVGVWHLVFSECFIFFSLFSIKR